MKPLLHRRRVAIAVSFTLLALLGTPLLAQSECPAGSKKVQRFGNPATRLSDRAVTSEDDLKQLFTKYRGDLEAVLGEAEWPGDPADLFAAVENGDGERVLIPAGTNFEWMAYRKSGRATFAENICYAGGDTIHGWKVVLDSNDDSYTFVTPEACLNLALLEITPITAQCSLKATYDAGSRTIRLTAESQGELKVTSIEAPSGAGDVSLIRTTDDMVWSFTPDEPGQYTFSAGVSNRHGSDSCEVTVNVPAPPTAPPTPTAPPPPVTPPTPPPPPSTPSLAGGDSAWIVRLFYADIKTDGDTISLTGTHPNGQPFTTHTTIDSGDGFGAGVEYLFRRGRPTMGLELGVMVGDLEGRLMADLPDAWQTVERDVDMTAISLGLNFHLTPDRRVDFFLGPIVANISYDDVTFPALGTSVRRDFDDDFAVGLNVGIDVPFTRDSSWAFTAGARWFDSTVEESTEGFDLDINPLIGMAGIAYRF